ncbi:MAG: hypothetical protein EXR69_01475 [Myxococcales bacterium]|nr:hypothetical protein [Myxococcales bacterium]
MPDLDPYTLFAGLAFSAAGGAAWVYGKRTSKMRPMLLGAALVGVPFLLNGIALWCAGAVLCALVVWP